MNDIDDTQLVGADETRELTEAHVETVVSRDDLTSVCAAGCEHYDWYEGGCLVGRLARTVAALRAELDTVRTQLAESSSTSSGDSHG